MSNVIIGDKAKPLGAYPHYRRVGDFIFISGTSSRRSDDSHEGVAINPDGSVTLDIRKQTRAVILNIEKTLEAAGATLTDLAEITTYLVNMDDFQGYNEVYGDFFKAENGPTRTTVAVRQLPHLNLLIEMKAIAFAPLRENKK